MLYSKRGSDMDGGTKEVMSETASLKPLGAWALIFGVLLPGATVLIELASRMCASTFFDPMPTWMMAALVAAVPVANLILWRALQEERDVPTWTLRLFGGAFLVSLIFMLVMLPLYPISVIAIIIYGLGLLPFAPLFAMIITARGLNRLADRQEGVWRQARFGMLIGAGVLLVADLPVSATRLAVDWAGKNNGKDQSAVNLMRWFGNETDLLRMSYGASGNGGGLSSMLLLGNWSSNIWGEGVIDDTVTARQLYFRTTGKAYNGVRAPRGARGEGTWFGRGDDDQGGSSVGGKLDTLSLASSRIDGSISTEDNLAYAEWTTEIANADDRPGEARFTMALPEGAVASRATLWINGEPREASIAGRAETRAAYSQVVSRQRDPLLVTTTGSGRLLVQAFPVPAKGTMKFRIGYSAPLAIARDGSRSLAMPAIVEENFDIDPAQKHAVWFEGGGLSAQPGWTPKRLANGVMRLQAVIDDGTLRTERPRIVTPAIRMVSTRTGTIKGDAGTPAVSVAQIIEPVDAPKPGELAILLDGSITNARAGEALANALDAITPGTPVSLSVAAEAPASVPSAPWSPAQRARFVRALDSVNFAGGVDNIPALTQLLGTVADPSATLLWIHGPQPADFPQTTMQLNQFMDRDGAHLPRLIRYQAEPGRAYTLAENAWFETARMVSPSGNQGVDLKALFADITRPGQRWQVSRAQTTNTGVGSPHIVRLWGGGTLAANSPYREEGRTKAIALAHQLNIITPVSGAVVLESNEDYKRNGLPVPSADKVPSVPEPHEWALILIVVGYGLYALRRRWRTSARAGVAFA
jgi:Vault protein inter-alpha-trypsin domain